MESSKEALRRMGASNQVLFDALLARSPDKVFFKDSESRFVVVSESMTRHFGASSTAELIGKTDFDFFSAEHAQQAFEDEREVLRTGMPIYREAEKETWPDGSIQWASTIKAPILGEDGSPIGVLGISRDVTREKEAHDALERHDRLLQEQNDIMTADLDNARMVQGLLIPGTLRSCEMLRAAVAYEPSHRVSGDVITFPRPDEPEYRFFLGDVCGHGVSAGIYTVLVKYLADRLSRGEDARPSTVLAKMNAALKDVLPNRFVTALLGVARSEGDGSLRLDLSHAAHPAFLLRRAGGSAEIVRLPSSPGLGLIGDASYPEQSFRLRKGDRALFFTDGLEEALNPEGEEFGLKHLAEAFDASADRDLPEVPGFLLGKIREFRREAPKTDDQSCLAFEVADLSA